MQNQQSQLLSRKDYKIIKRYNRAEMETFTRNLFENGFKEGFSNGSEASSQTNFKIELVQLLDSIKGQGIGPKTKEIILKAYKERGGKEQ